MTFQIQHVVVYGTNGRSRLVTFKPGELNIITGSSRRGKSAILTIIDYCLGSKGFPVKGGVTRENSVAFGLMLVTGNRFIYVARPAPEGVRKTADRMHISVVDSPDNVPALSQLDFNTNVDSAKEILDELCGIDPTLRLPVPGITGTIPPTIRHTLYFTIQGQSEIANENLLFHSQAEEFQPNHIRAVIPYFLGAVDSEYAALTIRLRTLKKELAAHKRELAERSALLGATGQARALLAEAAAVGLVGDLPPQGISETLAISQLREVIQIEIQGLTEPGQQTDRLTDLYRERSELRGQLNGLNIQLTRLRHAASENSDYATEVHEQRGRLASLNLLGEDHYRDACPLCGTDGTAGAGTQVTWMRQELSRLETEMVAVRTDSPKIEEMVAAIGEQIQDLTVKLRSNKAELDELAAANAAVSRLRDQRERTALVQGRAGFYLEMMDRRAGQPEVADRTQEIEAEIERIETRLEENSNPDLLETFLSLIGRKISDKARFMKVEHSEWPIRLDPRRLTIVVDKPNGSLALRDIGSGENHVGYHVATFLALHEWFVENNRPVPRFLIIDQPSQVWFPKNYSGDGSHVLPDEDHQALVRIYQAMLNTVEHLAPGLQIIVMEHADLEESWFSEAVRYRWREPGTGLIPAEWLKGDEIEES